MITIVFRLASLIMRWLPWSTLDPIAKFAGAQAMKRAPHKQKKLEHNLDAAGLGDQRSVLVPQVFYNYALYYLEVLKVRASDLDDIMARLKFDQEKAFKAAIATGRPIVIATTHLGNWDLAGGLLSKLHPKVAVVAEVLKPASLFEWFKATREALGMQVIGLDLSAGKTCLKHLKAGGALALVSDRDLTGHGLPVKFMGQSVSFTRGPAQLALRSKALVFTACLVRVSPGTYEVRMQPAIDFRPGKDFDDDMFKLTSQIASNLEELIRGCPEQWCMLQALNHHG